jgi:V/A-type H+-transporting ATPase subunit I
MLKPKKMLFVQCAAAKQHQKQLVETLHGLGVVHLQDYAAQDYFTRGSPMPGAEASSARVLKIRAILSQLGVAPKPVKPAEFDEGLFERLWQAFTTLSDERKKASEEAASLESARKTIAPLSEMGLSTRDLRGYSSVKAFFGIVKDAKALRIGVENETRIAGEHVAVFVKAGDSQKAFADLAAAGFQELQAADVAFSLAELDERLKTARNKVGVIDKKLADFKTANASLLLSWERWLDQEVEKAEAPLRFATSDRAFIVTGFIPADSLGRLKAALGESVHVETHEVHEEDAPVVLDNPGPVRWAEFFMNLYAMPRYLEIDPTVLMFLTFPLFFGFMLGDVGYGIIELGLFAALRWKMGKHPLLNMLILSAFASIAFGFVFGEFFGFEFLAHPLVHRAADVNTMLLLSVAIGVAHLNLGFIIGFINTLHHGLAHAVMEKGSWLLLEAGVALVALDHMGIAPGLTIPGVVAILAAIGLLFKGEGLAGIVEIPTLLSNTLSYARLFALGLASVALAGVVNKFASDFLSQGGFWLAVGVFVFVVGHGINIALGVIGPFLHSLRLHYVEFFTKFFKGGGEPYSPFGAVSH